MNDDSLHPTHYTRLIKTKALELGFSACGITRAEFLEEDSKHLEHSLNMGYNGEMQYLKNNSDKRTNPQLVIEGAKSVISLIINYYPPVKQNEKSYYKICKYGYGRDYHKVLKEKLNKLEAFIKEIYPDANTKSFTDSSPVLEKSLAHKSGLGWIGKQSLLINKDYGTFCFIGGVLIDKELDYDKPFDKDLCGKCNKCIEACPTQAIVAPRVLDARRCITYNTIELRTDMPEDIKGKLFNWIYGCDICQDVCPWNSKPVPTNEWDFIPKSEMIYMIRQDWENLTPKQFDSLFNDSAVKRVKYEGLIRNIKINGEL